MDLWTEASRDVEAETSSLRMAHAKVAVASLWPFLTLAKTEREFEHRLALASDHIANAVPVDLLTPVHDSLRQDYRLMHSAAETTGEGPTDPAEARATPMPSPVEPQISGQPEADMNPQATPGRTAAKDAEGEEEASEDGDDSKPDWLKKKIDKKESSLFWHEGAQRWVAARVGSDPEDHPEPWEAERDAEEDRRDRRGGTDPSPYSHAYADPWNEGGVHHATRAAFWHEGSQRWVQAAVDHPEGGGNPYYFTGGPEAGPNTGQTNQFPPHPTGQDPIDPINQMFPMQPSPWTVPPGGEWKESPMIFDPPGGGYHPYGKTGAGRYQDEGVETGPPGGKNPYYFSGGGEGAQGDQGASFPEDVTLPEDEEDRASTLYGQTPISGGTVDNGNHVAYRTAQTWSGYAGDPEPDNPAPDSDKLLGTEFDSPQERQRWNTAQDPEAQQGSRASFSASFHDPNDPGVRSVAMAGPDSKAMGLNGGIADIVNHNGGGVNSGGANTPQSTPPRQMPGSGASGMDPVSTPGAGGGAASMAPGGAGDAFGNGAPDPSQTSTSDQAAKQAFLRSLGMDSYERPNDLDPTGAGDEYKHNTWDGEIKTRPRQSAEHRNINTPQTSAGPIQTLNTDSPGDQRDDEQQREASRVAALAVQSLMAGAR